MTSGSKEGLKILPIIPALPPEGSEGDAVSCGSQLTLARLLPAPFGP